MYRVHSKLAMRHAINTKYSNYIYTFTRYAIYNVSVTKRY